MKLPFPYSSKEDITIRIPTDVCQELLEDVDLTKLVSEKVITIYERYKDILSASTKELLERLSSSELNCIKSCYKVVAEIPERVQEIQDPNEIKLNFRGDAEIPERIRTHAGEVVYFLENNDKFDDFCTENGVDGDELIDKCKALTAAQVDALFTWIKE